MSTRALVALAVGLALAGGAFAEAGCPTATEIAQQHLLGLWRAEFADGGAGATLLLEPHPEYAQGVRGAINRAGERALLAGDADAGEFTLEESANGVNIGAVWLGEVVEGSCGREIRGTWKAEGDPRTRDFVLRKR